MWNKFFAICLTVLGVALSAQAVAYNGNLEDISLNAVAEKQLAPDVAYVNFAIEGRGATSAEAVQSVANKAALVKKNLLKQAIVADSLEQVYYNVNPITNDKGKINGYIAHNQLKLKVDNIANIGNVIDCLATSGIDRLDNVDFSVKNKEHYQNLLLKEAVAIAKNKAQIVAEAGNRKVGRLLSVRLNSYTPVARFANSVAMSKAADIEAVTIIEPKNITIRAEVDTIFALE